MAKGLIRLQEGLHHRLLKLRSIDAIIQSRSFERLWDDSGREQQKVVEAAINDCNPFTIRDWMRHHPSLELAEKKLSVLQEIAVRLGIRNISRQGKMELVNAIMQKEKYGS